MATKTLDKILATLLASGALAVGANQLTKDDATSAQVPALALPAPTPTATPLARVGERFRDKFSFLNGIEYTEYAVMDSVALSNSPKGLTRAYEIGERGDSMPAYELVTVQCSGKQEEVILLVDKKRGHFYLSPSRSGIIEGVYLLADESIPYQWRECPLPSVLHGAQLQEHVNDVLARIEPNMQGIPAFTLTTIDTLLSHAIHIQTDVVDTTGRSLEDPDVYARILSLQCPGGKARVYGVIDLGPKQFLEIVNDHVRSISHLDFSEHMHPPQCFTTESEQHQTHLTTSESTGPNGLATRDRSVLRHPRSTT